MSSQDGLLFV